jgi:probable F420-dependent oxidoreductase
MELGPLGVWWSGARRESGGLDGEAAQALEEAGYGAIWSSAGFHPGLSSRFETLLKATDRLVVASGIASIWVNEPAELAGTASALYEAYGGRFLLGIGASHAAIVEGYENPYSHVVSFLDGLDAAEPTVAPERRVLAALGPRMLRLAAARSAGAHPYFVPVEHTRRARRTLGSGALLAPEMTAVVETDAGRARGRARAFTTGYLGLPNYAGNLRRLGHAGEALTGGGSDRVVDDVVAWGDVEAVAARVREHVEAGADHVCVQLLAAGDEFPLDDYLALAAAIL